MYSAFGIDHGEIAKFDYGNNKKPSAGRRVLASAPYTSMVHPFVAGKKGKKARAAGNQLGGSILGGGLGAAAGSVPGLIARKPGLALAGQSLGGFGGSIAGTQGGLARNTRKGYLKKET